MDEAFRPFSPGEITFQCKNDKGCPDKPEANRLGGRKGLLVDQDTKQELDGRRDILKDAYQRKRYAVDCCSKEKQRNRSYHSPADKKGIRQETTSKKGALSGGVRIDEVGQYREEENACFQGETME